MSGWGPSLGVLCISVCYAKVDVNLLVTLRCWHSNDLSTCAVRAAGFDGQRQLDQAERFDPHQGKGSAVERREDMLRRFSQRLQRLRMRSLQTSCCISTYHRLWNYFARFLGDLAVHELQAHLGKVCSSFSRYVVVVVLDVSRRGGPARTQQCRERETIRASYYMDGLGTRAGAASAVVKGRDRLRQV